MPSRYTAQEYANMHLIYGECLCNANAAARVYRERYSNAERHPAHRVFINVHRSFSEGRFPSQMVGEGRPSRPTRTKGSRRSNYTQVSQYVELNKPLECPKVPPIVF
ncbi:Transposase-like protein [Operophtera brumata]|uniref:Transposase-like protein n=1 Tax=Operophtera brumata TaxID=104452 RepID=A0A0L7KGZ8_OPEBR|nr:Transposase-like protein [Operophtera brumata]